MFIYELIYLALNYFLYEPATNQEPEVQLLFLVRVCRLVCVNCFVIYTRMLIFSFELFTFFMSGPFIAQYTVWCWFSHY